MFSFLVIYFQLSNTATLESDVSTQLSGLGADAQKVVDEEWTTDTPTGEEKLIIS